MGCKLRYYETLYNFPRFVFDNSIERQLKVNPDFKAQLPRVREEFILEKQFHDLRRVFSMYDQYTNFAVGQSYYPVSVVCLGIAGLLEMQYFDTKQKVIRYEHNFFEKVTLQGKTTTVMPTSNNHFSSIAKTFFFKKKYQMEHFMTYVTLVMSCEEILVSKCKFPRIVIQKDRSSFASSWFV
jgi:hypothetical protein